LSVGTSPITTKASGAENRQVRQDIVEIFALDVLEDVGARHQVEGPELGKLLKLSTAGS
jgi:hypothetical protein